jgi:molybdate transport system substrate-binding protein
VRRVLATVAVALLVASVATGCGRDDEPAATPSAGDVELHGPLRVFAAASLTEAFTELATRFEAAHRDVDVQLTFAGSSALAQQLVDGAPADVFTSADEANLAKVVDAGRAGTPVVVARNRLAILVERDNPKGIAGLADLTDPGVVVVLCAPEVPCGRFAAAALAKAGVDLHPASLEQDVKAVVAKVTLGEADAGIVYATDVRAAGDRAEGIPLAGADDPALEAVYPMATLTDAGNPKAAAAWTAFVRSPAGRAVLTSRGFLDP